MMSIYILLSAYIITAAFAIWAIFNNKRLIEWEDKVWAKFKKYISKRMRRYKNGTV